MAAKTIKVKLVKSPSHSPRKVQATVLGLGLKRLQMVRELENTPAVRGMIKKVIHLVEIQWGCYVNAQKY